MTLNNGIKIKPKHEFYILHMTTILMLLDNWTERQTVDQTEGIPQDGFVAHDTNTHVRKLCVDGHMFSSRQFQHHDQTSISVSCAFTMLKLNTHTHTHTLHKIRYIK